MDARRLGLVDAGFGRALLEPAPFGNGSVAQPRRGRAPNLDDRGAQRHSEHVREGRAVHSDQPIDRVEEARRAGVAHHHKHPLWLMSCAHGVACAAVPFRCSSEERAKAADHLTLVPESTRLWGRPRDEGHFARRGLARWASVSACIEHAEQAGS